MRRSPQRDNRVFWSALAAICIGAYIGVEADLLVLYYALFIPALWAFVLWYFRANLLAAFVGRSSLLPVVAYAASLVGAVLLWQLDASGWVWLGYILLSAMAWSWWGRSRTRGDRTV